MTLNNKNETEEAIKCFDEALSYKPDRADIWYSKSQMLCGSILTIDKGLACLDKALALDPEYTDAWYQKGRMLKITNTLHKGKDLKEAEACIKKAAALGHPEAIKMTKNKLFGIKWG
jgi:tetratricopeptide (TPR) repeat protein